jgi:hypothetical protein
MAVGDQLNIPWMNREGQLEVKEPVSPARAFERPSDLCAAARTPVLQRRNLD